MAVRMRDASPWAGRIALRWSISGSDGIRTGLQLFVLTRFLQANRYPLRSKMLQSACDMRRIKIATSPIVKGPGLHGRGRMVILWNDQRRETRKGLDRAVDGVHHTVHPYRRQRAIECRNWKSPVVHRKTELQQLPRPLRGNHIARRTKAIVEPHC